MAYVLHLIVRLLPFGPVLNTTLTSENDITNRTLVLEHDYQDGKLDRWEGNCYIRVSRMADVVPAYFRVICIYPDDVSPVRTF